MQGVGYYPMRVFWYKETNEQQEIDDQITRIREEWDGLKSIRGNEARLTKIMEPILYLASFLESKGHRQESIEDEIVHLLKGMTNEVTIRLTLRFC